MKFKKVLMFCVVIGLWNVANAETLNRILAYANKEIITQAQFNREYQLAHLQLESMKAVAPPDAKLKQQILDQLINQSLQLQRAKELGMTVDDATLQKAIAHVAQQNKMTVAQLKQVVQSQGISYAEYSENIRAQLTLNKLQQKAVGDKVSVTPHEVNVFRQRYIAEHVQYRYQVEDVVVAFPENADKTAIAAAEKEAKNVLAQLKKQTPTASLASSTVSVNDLGLRALQELPALFSERVKNMKVDGVIGPVKAPNGFHLIKLIAKKAEGDVQIPTQAEAQQMVYAKKMNIEVAAWLKEMRKTAYVRIVQK